MNYRELYEIKRTTPEAIAAQIQPGWVCATDIAASIPPAIINALGENAVKESKSEITLHTLLDLKKLRCLEPDLSPYITPVSWFSGGGLKRAANEGRGDIMSCYYQDMPSLFRNYVEPDAVFFAAAPMDAHGYFSLGVVGSISEALIEKARHIYIEVNEYMPRALHGPMVHISQVTALCEHTEPLPILPPVVIDETSRKIAGYISEEIPDGATLQLGIGAVPEAVGMSLRDKKNLGIHTELFTDSMVELIQCGAVNNSSKSINRGKTIATLAFGSQRIYDFIHENPSFELLPVDYVNNPAVIAQHDNFISVNAALEIDFYGQVCAESVGTQHVSGSGGQVDYVRGAVMSKGGKSFIAFPSTAKNGEISRIKATLMPGAIVTTSKNDVDYIVTEYGAVKLRGKSLSQRTKALISIAHPKFRDTLTYQAKKQNIMI